MEYSHILGFVEHVIIVYSIELVKVKSETKNKIKLKI